ncbi:gliotoxin biosynthesis protein GliK [Diplocarpon rosae]|nr:gliotoxin biosynthesis protein GliK [Diplocarpon rosae]
MITQKFIRDGQQAFATLQNLWPFKIRHSRSPRLPTTSPSRLVSTTHSTILYLAYGSNLSAQTFKGTRGINPLSALNVHVPSLTLTFDLPGIPYKEPCFANTRYSSPPSPSNTGYRKDRWHKGLVGVVYEVTPEDYRTIIATEGGGASYHDVVVPCYAIAPGSKTINAMPSGIPFSAHTLLLWVPMLLFVLGLGKVFADDDGKVPGWLAGLMGMLMKGIWGTYDRCLMKRFGDGERTIGDEEDEEKGMNWIYKIISASVEAKGNAETILEKV